MRIRNLSILELMWRLESLAALKDRCWQRAERARSMEELLYWSDIVTRATLWISRTERDVINHVLRSQVAAINIVTAPLEKLLVA